MTLTQESASAWSTDHELAATVLDALPDATAVIDHTCPIIGVNYTWRMLALDNGGREDSMPHSTTRSPAW